ncbi:MAG: alpha/beta hydrolase-fold protein [Gammaproteobacteria bacterium]|nr:alpha/beta hydrolase-fold protein [Gammaproteobacteria bacterium]
MTRGVSRRGFVAATGGLLAGAAGAMEIENYRRLGLDKRFDLPFDATINGRSNMEIMDALNPPEDAQYNPCPEAYPAPDVPRGDMRKFPGWSQSDIYPNTVRDVLIHVPEQLAASTDDPAVMVFNDGAAYADETGPVRAPAVLDSLIHAGEIPPTVGIFVNPGAPADGDAIVTGQRSYEYDSVTDTYVRFLVTELLPFAEQEIGRTFSEDPAHRTIVGISSGGICAFNAAWHDPTAFARVLSHCGSFVNLRGGHNYPYLVKTTPRKPIRVFLTSGKRDANIIVGNWPLANKMMAAALEYAGYDYRFEFGEGGHSAAHGGAIFAESLRWLSRSPAP